MAVRPFLGAASGPFVAESAKPGLHFNSPRDRREKILLLKDLWDSIASDESSVPVPQSHRDELDRRLTQYEKNPGSLLTLDDLRE